MFLARLEWECPQHGLVTHVVGQENYLPRLFGSKKKKGYLAIGRASHRGKSYPTYDLRKYSLTSLSLAGFGPPRPVGALAHG